MKDPFGNDLDAVPNGDVGDDLLVIGGTSMGIDAIVRMVDEALVEGEDSLDAIVAETIRRQDMYRLLLGYVLSRALADARYGDSYVEKVARQYYGKSSSSLYIYIQVVELWGFEQAARWLSETRMTMSHLSWLSADCRTESERERGFWAVFERNASVRGMKAYAMDSEGGIVLAWPRRLDRVARRLLRLANSGDAPPGQAQTLARLARAIRQDKSLVELKRLLDDFEGTTDETLEAVTPRRPQPPVVGPRLDFRGLHYEPINEQGVVFLFGMVSQELDFQIEALRARYPDCMGKKRVAGKQDRWEHVRIEFEYRSSNFLKHGHDPADCDLIVCWIDDWEDCPIEVLELQSEIQSPPKE